MASEEILPDAQVPISKCEVCDRGVDARFYCQECTQEMCEDCQKRHLRMTFCMNHTIIRIAADKDASVHQTETSTLRCQTHPDETIQMYCLTCTSPVCHSCISDKIHRNHELDKLAKIAGKYKEQLSEFIMETKQEMARLEASLQCVQNNIQDYIKLADTIISDINKQREQNKAEADKVADGLILEVERCKDRDVKSLKQEGDKIKKVISDDKELMRSYEEKLKSDIDTSIKEFKTIFGHKKKNSTFSIPLLNPQLFVGDDIKILQNIFGKLEEKDNTTVGVLNDRKPVTADNSVSTNVISSFNPGIRSIVVATVSDKETWCGDGLGWGRNLILVQTNGTVKKTIKLNKSLYDITVTKNNDVLYTEMGGYKLQKYSLDEKVTVISNTKPHTPKGICITADSDLLVCLYNGDTDNKVVRMSLNGQIKQSIQYNKQNKPIYSNPRLVTENINGDICVVDASNNVTVVNKDGQFRFRYPDSDKSTHTIRDCCGIACDKVGFILISDYNNFQIHQIDCDGNFVQSILTEQDGIKFPWGLSIDDKGQLWVCNGGSWEVRVYKYRS